MAHENRHNLIAPPPSQPSAGKAGFAGFAPPTSNTTYTPNQFFDVVLPNASRGCVRIVAYLLRKTLGWCDALGNPQHEQIAVSNSELERRAGVGHDMIRSALDEAVGMHFIQCVQAGRARSAGDAGETAVYALKWDATPRYARSLEEFRGFYEGEGHRTDIPNQFFDSLIPSETIAVTKVVGAVIRYSIGFVATRGHRRQQATLAYSQILKVSGLSSRRTLAAAIREAVAKKYIVRLDPGYFSARQSERRSATYAICWSDGFHAEPVDGNITPKRIPAGVGITPTEKDTSRSVEHSDPATSNPPKRIPADHSEKDTIETKHLNEKQKQQAEAVDLLRKEGFDPKTADQIASRYPHGLLIRQIKWLPLRHVTKSRAGLLRRAIEGDWPEPGREPQTYSRFPLAPPQPLPPAYLTWLAEQQTAFRDESPDDYQRFLAKRNRLRIDHGKERSSHLREHLLTTHDQPVGHLMDFQKFFALPDVQRWADIINNQSPNPQS
jgi:hypothetical protein